MASLTQEKKDYLKKYYKERLKKRRQEKAKEEAKNKPPTERQIEVVCKVCGKTIIAKNKNKSICDECKRKRRAEHNKKPEIKEQLRARARERYKNNPDKYKNYHKEWRQSKKEAKNND